MDRDSLGGPCSDDHPGTLTQPWYAVERAHAMLVAGDTLYLRAGTYRGETIRPANSASSPTRHISYTRYQDEEATFTASVYGIRLIEKSYDTILGLRFVDGERNQYLDTSHHIHVGECSFDNPG